EAFVWPQGMFERDRPATRFATAMTASQDAAVAAVEQAIAQFLFGEQIGGTVERVAFPDGSQVDFHSWLQEVSCLFLRIEFQLLVADSRQCGFDFISRRHSSLAAIEAPGLAQLAGGDIERSARLCGE